MFSQHHAIYNSRVMQLTKQILHVVSSYKIPQLLQIYREGHIYVQVYSTVRLAHAYLLPKGIWHQALHRSKIRLVSMDLQFVTNKEDREARRQLSRN